MFQDDTLLLLLEYDHISYEEYIENVSEIPQEYATVDLFYKNKGKVLRQRKKDLLWRDKT